MDVGDPFLLYFWTTAAMFCFIWGQDDPAPGKKHGREITNNKGQGRCHTHEVNNERIALRTAGHGKHGVSDAGKSSGGGGVKAIQAGVEQRGVHAQGQRADSA